MGKLDQTLKKIIARDESAVKTVQARLDSLTKPQGSLGKLEELAKTIGGIKRKSNFSLSRKAIFTFASDHGVTAERISAFPSEVTKQMVYNFLNGGAGINVLARHAGAEVVIIDIGVASDIEPHPDLMIKKVNYGTKNMAKEPAMSRQEAIKSIEIGIEIFETKLKDGLDIAGIGEMGIGNTTASSAITSCVTKKSAKAVTGRGTGLSNPEFSHKIKVIEHSLRLHKPDSEDALDILSKIGGFEIGGMAGIILAGAAHRIPVMLDGFISGAAALIACTLAPLAKDYLIASHCSVEQGHAIILRHLGLTPLLQLDLRLGEGTGAALGITIADASVKILTEMATFKSAQVSEKSI